MSDMAKYTREARKRRHARVRKGVVGTAARPRLAVFRSNRHVVAQVIAGGPTGPHNATRFVLFEALAQARSSILVTTGYFVPLPELAWALEAAAMRGVSVSLLVPGRSSYLWTIYAGRSYYESLLQAGVKIYEYRRGAMHAKTLTIDGRWSFVGSANFDARHRFAASLLWVFPGKIG